MCIRDRDNVKHTSTMHIQDHQLGHGSRWRCEPQVLDFRNFPIHERRGDSDVECLMPRCHQGWAEVHEGARTRASLKLTHRCVCVAPVGIHMQNHVISRYLLSKTTRRCGNDIEHELSIGPRASLPHCLHASAAGLKQCIDVSHRDNMLVHEKYIGPVPLNIVAAAAE